MIGEINTKPQAGGLDIQGIINQYEVYAGENISAGDFVGFANWIVPTINSDISIDDGVSYTAISHATLLTKNKIFVSYYYEKNVYGVICTINNNSISLGTKTQLATVTSRPGGYRRPIFSCKIDENKIFIAYHNKYKIDMIICTISGTSITAGNVYTEDFYYEGNVNVVALSSSKVFVSYVGNNSLYGLVCTISGSTITQGTSSILVSGNTTNRITSLSSIALSSSKIFTCHNYSSNKYGIVFTISGMTITIGNDTKLGSSYGNNPSAVLIDENKIFISSNGAFELYGSICNISGTSIIFDYDTQNILLSSNTCDDTQQSAILIKENQIFISCATNAGTVSDAYLYGIICTLNNNSFIVDNEFQLSSSRYSGYLGNTVVLANENQIFIAHGNGGSNYLNGMLLTNENLGILAITTSSQTIKGIAQEDGTGGDTIDVIEPYTS